MKGTIHMAGILMAFLGLLGCGKKEPSKTEVPQGSSSNPSSDENLGKAKQIFWEYACSSFHMRDGPVDEYKRLGGSEIHEAGWRKEYILHWSSRLSTEDLTALHKLHLAEANEALSDMEQTLMGGDDYARFWCAYVMADLVVSAELTDGALTEMRVDGHQSRHKECVARRVEACSKAVSM